MLVDDVPKERGGEGKEEELFPFFFSFFRMVLGPLLSSHFTKHCTLINLCSSIIAVFFFCVKFVPILVNSLL